MESRNSMKPASQRQAISLVQGRIKEAKLLRLQEEQEEDRVVGLQAPGAKMQTLALDILSDLGTPLWMQIQFGCLEIQLAMQLQDSAQIKDLQETLRSVQEKSPSRSKCN